MSFWPSGGLICVKFYTSGRRPSPSPHEGTICGYIKWVSLQQMIQQMLTAFRFPILGQPTVCVAVLFLRTHKFPNKCIGKVLDKTRRIAVQTIGRVDMKLMAAWASHDFLHQRAEAPNDQTLARGFVCVNRISMIEIMLIIIAGLLVAAVFLLKRMGRALNRFDDRDAP